MDLWSAFPVVLGLLSFVVWFAIVGAVIYAVVLLSRMSRDTAIMRRQLAAMAMQSGAPEPPPPARVNPPAWTWALVAAVVLLILGGLGLAATRPRDGGTFEYAPLESRQAVEPEVLPMPELEQAP